MKHFNGIDILRVMACCFVLLTHSDECYYISNFYEAGSADALDVVTWQNEAIWAGVFNSITRSCVPIFVMVSGFLLLPMKRGMTMGQFYKRRMMRVIIPLAVWTVVYAFYCAFKFAAPDWTTADYAGSIWHSLWWFFISFPAPIGHLWYVYMLIGLYLFIPVLSPWVERASKKEMQIVLAIWMISMLRPELHLLWPDVWGECYWNPNHTLYYFSGFIGYLLAGAYARKYMFDSKKNFVVPGVVIALLGYAACFGGFLYELYNLTPTAENYSNYFAEFEIFWAFDNVPVMLLSLGTFMIFFRMKANLPKVVTDFSRLSYGVYLAHIMFLTFFYEHVYDALAMPVPCKILCIWVSTVVTTYLVIKALSYLPKSKWIVG